VDCIAQIDEAAKAKTPPAEVLALVLQLQKTVEFPNDFKYYILMCGLFSPDERNIIKNWAAYEECFLQLAQTDGDLGIKHFMQSIIQYFVRKYPEQKVYANTFLKTLYEQEILSDEFFLKWHKKKKKLDKTCKLYDRKAEKLFREIINPFIEWLE
jgi:hypothetical protein